MAASPSSERPPGRVLRLSKLAPFVAYCIGGEVRAATRRNAIKRAATAYRKGVADDPYPPALILYQRLGLALEDLGRLALALRAEDGADPFNVLREARLDDIDIIYGELAADPERLRAGFHLPTPGGIEDLDKEVREAALELSDALARRWHKQWTTCAGSWMLLRQVAKRMRHGAPLIPRELVVDPPGSGMLGREANDDCERWVLVADTEVDDKAGQLTTEYIPADLSDKTIVHATQAGYEAVALARTLSGAHVTRVRTQSRWAFEPDALKLISPEARRVLRRERRG